jgi:hypothetical protein
MNSFKSNIREMSISSLHNSKFNSSSKFKLLCKMKWSNHRCSICRRSKNNSNRIWIHFKTVEWCSTNLLIPPLKLNEAPLWSLLSSLFLCQILCRCHTVQRLNLEMNLWLRASLIYLKASTSIRWCNLIKLACICSNKSKLSTKITRARSHR